MIYIDASRYNNTDRRTGVENYSYFLIPELVRQHPDEITLITPKQVDLKVPQIVIPFKRLWTHLRLSWEVFKRKNIKTLFVPSHVLPLYYAKKSIITIHDVAFKHSPQSYSWKSRWYLNWATKFAVKHAYKIITPSQKSKDDLIKYYHCPSKKIHVVPLGFAPPNLQITAKETKEVLKKYELEKGSYFLYLGRIEVKKNSDTLIKAFHQFSKTHPDHKLVMAGFPGHGGEEILKTIPPNLKDKIILPGYISVTEKQIFLQNTVCFVFPSREEGFGIPLLEAMYAEIPIIASNIPTSLEIARYNAFFFEVEDVEGLASQMSKITQLKRAKELKTEHHQAMLKKYSWEKCAEEVYKILHSPK